jgi:hypothetical protein
MLAVSLFPEKLKRKVLSVLEISGADGSKDRASCLFADHDTRNSFTYPSASCPDQLILIWVNNRAESGRPMDSTNIRTEGAWLFTRNSFSFRQEKKARKNPSHPKRNGLSL